MRTKMVLFCVGVLAIAGSLTIVSSASDAATTKVDLGTTGSTVAGYTAAQLGQELPVMFTMTNHSRTTTTDVAFVFTVSNASVDDYVCPTISTRLNIETDGQYCEPGSLRAGKSTSAAIIVTPAIALGTITVQACATSLDGHPDPVQTNDCKTISIPIR